MRLSRVTVTGADDSISPEEMVEITKAFPFVEWGILVSARVPAEGGPRFPSLAWLRRLRSAQHIHSLNISMHVCGAWVRQLCKGDWTEFDKSPVVETLLPIVQRVQLNFHSYAHKVVMPAFTDGFRGVPWTLLLQSDGVNDALIRTAKDNLKTVAVLHDKSGGAGELPEGWPALLRGMANGYAGGLSPMNVADELRKIEQIVGGETIWIDAESRLRSSDNASLLQSAVLVYLARAQPWT
jgi:hypothetical protein